MTKLTDAEKVNIMNDLLYSFKDSIDSNRFNSKSVDYLSSVDD